MSLRCFREQFQKNQDLHKVLGNLTMVLVGLLYPKYPQYQPRHLHNVLVEHDKVGGSILCNINLLNIINNISNAINISICTKFSLTVTWAAGKFSASAGAGRRHLA